MSGLLLRFVYVFHGFEFQRILHQSPWKRTFKSRFGKRNTVFKRSGKTRALLHFTKLELCWKLILILLKIFPPFVDKSSTFVEKFSNFAFVENFCRFVQKFFLPLLKILVPLLKFLTTSYEVAVVLAFARLRTLSQENFPRIKSVTESEN